MSPSASADSAFRLLAQQLRQREKDIEEASLLRIATLAPVQQDDPPEYLHGLVQAIQALVDFGLRCLEEGGGTEQELPRRLLLHSKAGARSGVPAGRMLRRYVITWNQLTAFLLDEAGRQKFGLGGSFWPLLQVLATQQERLLVEVERHYQEQADTLYDPQARLTERITRRLKGEPADLSDLNYNFGAHHLAAVVRGARAKTALRELAVVIDGRPLIVHAGGDMIWGWIGTESQISKPQVYDWLTANWPANHPCGLGEPAFDTTGWCLTHQQAVEAFPFAADSGRSFAGYLSVALKAAARRDPLASSALRRAYLEALGEDPRARQSLHATLRAFLHLGRNRASAAASLGLTRQTVSNRLQRIEEGLGPSLTLDCAEVVIASWLAETDDE